MAQRATGFAKRTTTPARTNRVGRSVRAVAEASVGLRAIPLDLAPLLAPYKKQGRVSFRVERLPQLACLSRGRNKGGGSWSLTPDELEDLTYLVPETMDEVHTLAIRVIDLDTDAGSTLAVLDFLVSPSAVEPDTVHEEAVADDSIVDARTEEELRRLRDQLAKAKATLAARETELSEARRQAEQAAIESAKLNSEPDLAAARAAWRAELDEQLAAAAAQATSELAQSRNAWEAEQTARTVTSAARAQERLAEARERWQRETQNALLEAEQVWKADAATQLAAAEAQWREQSAKNDAALTVRCEQAEAAAMAARAKADVHAAAARDHADAELHRLRDECARIRAALADREAELMQAHLAAEQARMNWQQESQTALSNAEAAWKSDMAARLAKAEAQWRQQSANAAAEATARAEAAETALAQVRRATQAARERSDNADIRRLQHEREALQTALAERETELARIHSATEQARELPAPDDRIVLRTNRAWQAAEPLEPPRTRGTRRAIGGMVMAASLAAATIAINPGIFGDSRAPVALPSPAPAHFAEQHRAVVVHDANVRAGPSTAAAIVSTLQRGLEVAMIEQRGNWMFVQIGGADGKTPSRQGWVYSSLLKGAPERSTTPPTSGRE